ncbi:unnamed protein product, partial [Cylicostephanus goldi]
MISVNVGAEAEACGCMDEVSRRSVRTLMSGSRGDFSFDGAEKDIILGDLEKDGSVFPVFDNLSLPSIESTIPVIDASTSMRASDGSSSSLLENQVGTVVALLQTEDHVISHARQIREISTLAGRFDDTTYYQQPAIGYAEKEDEYVQHPSDGTLIGTESFSTEPGVVTDSTALVEEENLQPGQTEETMYEEAVGLQARDIAFSAEDENEMATTSRAEPTFEESPTEQYAEIEVDTSSQANNFMQLTEEELAHIAHMLKIAEETSFGMPALRMPFTSNRSEIVKITRFGVSTPLQGTRISEESLDETSELVQKQSFDHSTENDIYHTDAQDKITAIIEELTTDELIRDALDHTPYVQDIVEIPLESCVDTSTTHAADVTAPTVASETGAPKVHEYQDM